MEATGGWLVSDPRRAYSIETDHLNGVYNNHIATPLESELVMFIQRDCEMESTFGTIDSYG